MGKRGRRLARQEGVRKQPTETKRAFRQRALVKLRELDAEVGNVISRP